MTHPILTWYVILALIAWPVPGEGTEVCDPLVVRGELDGKIEPKEWRLSYEKFQVEMRTRLEKVAAEPAQADRVRKETYSLIHQETLIQRTRRAIAKLGSIFSRRGERSGRLFQEDVEVSIADSDKGKLEIFRDMVWFPKTAGDLAYSNALLDFISLRPTSDVNITAAQKILEEVLIADFDGRPGEGLQPKRFTNDEIRNVMKNNFFLPGALHDHPGMLDALLEFCAYGDAPRLRNRLRYNIGHNGPGRNNTPKDGFWGFLFTVLVPGQLEKSGNANYFEGTIYWRQGKVAYPEGSSVGWFIHTATDRLSGEVNILKFMAELSKEDMINTLATSYDAAGVIAQYDQLAARLSEVSGRLESSEIAAVGNYIAELRGDQQAYARALGSRLRFSAPVNGKIDGVSIVNERGEVLGSYSVDRTSGKLLRDGQEISRAEMFERIGKELFEPVRSLDPLLQGGP